MIKLGTFPLVTLLGAGLAASLLAPPLLIAQGAGTRGRAAGPAGADAITEDQLRAHLSFIASDLLEGRATGSRGLDVAGAFLASHLGRLGLRYDYSLDDPSDPAQIYQRSDHYQYARQGIPIAFFFTGIHEDYHGLDDEIDRIDFTKMRRIVQTIYATARAVADDPAMSRRSADRTQP